MRVISGKYRGLALKEFNVGGIRPTADRVKESLFNILMSRVSGARALDLFCGSGSLGIECLSRGADFVHFNDASKESLNVAMSNIKKLSGVHDIQITRADYADCLNSLKKPFDIIFIDPPYADDCGIYALQLISKLNLLTSGGVAVYERDRSFEGVIDGLEKYDERKYGKTYLSFFKKEEV
ncbi:MAG: 16S rRNA (guanine(966)-N(2))-methyltransferase RsmD [Clostridia bacterium]|nr:16S rRNA (guanine(966)-N(2))-methyltransferase RsmD [Clostridia bacterium]